MRISRMGVPLAIVAVLLMIANSAVAQDGQRKRTRDGNNPQTQTMPKNPAPVQAAPQGGGACSPSGFARLSRNCSTNTGGCQRMPETCNRGWCCP